MSIDWESIQRYLTTGRLGRQLGFCELWDEIDSTNTRAITIAANGAPEGSVVLARKQSAGRGRQGRTWVSPPDSGIYMSVVLRPTLAPASIPLTSLATGVAVTDAIAEAAGVRAGLKWVNDIVYDGKKLGGILAEMTTVSPPARPPDRSGATGLAHPSDRSLPADRDRAMDSIPADDDRSLDYSLPTNRDRGVMGGVPADDHRSLDGSLPADCDLGVMDSALADDDRFLDRALPATHDSFIDSASRVDSAPRLAAETRCLIVGIGLNVRLDPADLDDELRNRVDWIERTTGAPLDDNQLAAFILNNLEQRYADLSEGRAERIVQMWRERSVTLGRSIRATTGNRILEGTAVDIDSDGALIVATTHGDIKLHAGEISIRLTDGSYC